MADENAIDEVLESYLTETLWEEMSRLDKYRCIAYLMVVHKLTTHECALRLGASPHSVKNFASIMRGAGTLVAIARAERPPQRGAPRLVEIPTLRRPLPPFSERERAIGIDRIYLVKSSA